MEYLRSGREYLRSGMVYLRSGMVYMGSGMVYTVSGMVYPGSGMVNTRSGMVLKYLKATKTYQWTLGTQELTLIVSKPGIGPSLDHTRPYDWTLQFS